MLTEARLAAIRQLLLKVQKHEATAPELAVLRNMLRDNGMILEIDTEDTQGEAAREVMGFALPSLNEPDEEE